MNRCRFACLSLLACLLLTPAHAAKKWMPDPAPDAPKQSDYTVVIPSKGLPGNVTPQNANNNLDVVMHGGRVFLAFRTGPTHFASPKVELYVVSSEDQVNWRFEGRFFRETDLREPRFLSYKGKLYFYFAVLGKNAANFEPEGTLVTEYIEPGKWTEPQWLPEKSFIPWRTRVIDGTAYLIGYKGGGDIYEFAELGSMDLMWLTTEDGKHFTGVDKDQPVVYKGGCSETDWAFLKDGGAVAVCRNELGDQDGYGSKVCTAPAGDLGTWTCKHDPKKYDSPLVFKHGEDVYLVGRRHLVNNGNFEKGDSKKADTNRTIQLQMDYWRNPKRCAIWKVHPDTRTVSFVDDLPSKGDTCFASVIPAGPDSVWLYNYSSPPDGPDLSWQKGQAGHTLIYRLKLTFQ